jgi:hypothetical protein
MMHHWQMYNWHAMETEAEHRWLEWHRAVAADALARAALPPPKQSKPRQAPLPRMSWWSLKLKRLVVQGASFVTAIISRQNTNFAYPTVESCRASRTTGA